MFEELPGYFAKQLYYFRFPPAMYERPLSQHPCQCLLFSIFLILANLVRVKWYVSLVSIYISLITNDVKHLFMCLLYFFEKCLFRAFAHFTLGCLFRLLSEKS